MKKVVLLCGTNEGNRVQNLSNAETLLKQNKEVKLLKKSALYETAPWGDTEQDAFLNQAFLVETYLEPFQILHLIKDVEVQVGRVNTRRWGPRIIDIDILYFEDFVLNSEKLTIPHAEVQNRAFALVPAAEIAPEWIDPRNKKTISELANSCKDTLEVKRMEFLKNEV